METSSLFLEEIKKVKRK